MLTLNMLGHVYVTNNGHTVPVSHKGAALLSYLALEGQSHHREHLAELLWDHPQSLRNLRVELTRLKQQGISPFPARQPMLSLNCPTDLEQWISVSADLTESTLPAWLSCARGFPLSGLEDVGSVTFRHWVDQQRWRISERMERTLGEVYRRFSQRSQVQAMAQIRERAERLGLTVPELDPAPVDPAPVDPAPVDPAPVDPAPFDPAQPGAAPAHEASPLSPDAATGVALPGTPQAELRRVAEQAQSSCRSQLVFLHGLPGTPRALVDRAFQGTPWKVMQLHVSDQRRLVQAALIQQLMPALPEYKPQLLDLLGHLSEAGELDLIRLSALLAQADRPLVLAVHLTEKQAWFLNAVRFLLDFPHPIVLALCTTSGRLQRALQAELGGLNWTQQHRLTIAPLGTQGVLRAMQQRGRSCTLGQASRLAQCTEGWPLYLETLPDSLSLPGAARLGQAAPCPPQPDAVTHAVLTGLQALPGETRWPLARLAQIQDRFNVEQAAHVLDEPDTAAVLKLLRFGREQDLLVPAAPRESVQLPTLSTWVDDLETHLAFASETLRVALATQLPPQERHQARLRLSAHYQHRCPAMHQHYAARAGLTGCTGQQPPSASAPQPPASAPLEGPALTPPVARWQPLPDHALTLTTAPRQELRTPNGYRVALEGGTLEILRKGRLGPAPTLALPFGPLPAGTWQLTVRFDLYRNYTLEPCPYALGLRSAAEGLVTYTVPDPDPPGQPPLEGTTLPAQQWVQLSGDSSGGLFELSFCAMDLALTIAEFTWNGQSLLTTDRVPA